MSRSSGPAIRVVSTVNTTLSTRPVSYTHLQYIVRDGWEAAESGWYYNLSDRTIWVKFAKPAKKDFTVTISTEKFDLIGMAED